MKKYMLRLKPLTNEIRNADIQKLPRTINATLMDKQYVTDLEDFPMVPKPIFELLYNEVHPTTQNPLF